MWNKIRPVFEYILAALLMLGGVQTAASWQSENVLSQQFFTPYLVLVFGIAFFVAGAGMALSKIKKWTTYEGVFLYLSFMLLLFSLLLEVTVYLAVSDWLDNLILFVWAAVLRVSHFVKEEKDGQAEASTDPESL